MIETQPVIDLELEREPQAARRARDSLEALADQLSADTLSELRLVVSELVTNGVRHSTGQPGGAIHLRVWMHDDSVRIEATDAGGGFDPSMPPAAAGSGWGLRLVGRLATRWGVTAAEKGTTVWFERSLETPAVT